MTYTKVDRESTALGDLGLHYYEVAKGEYAELDPVKKTNRKGVYLEHEVVEAVIGAYAEDLQKAYQSNESMEAVLHSQREELRDFKVEYEGMQKKLNTLFEAQKQLHEFETLVAQMEQQMGVFNEDKEQNMASIADLEVRTQEIDNLRADVEQILDNLSVYFVDEGFPPLESEEYD